jgi:hypothetical protein
VFGILGEDSVDRGGTMPPQGLVVLEQPSSALERHRGGVHDLLPSLA